MDVLSDVLDTVRLSSTVFVRTEVSPPWGIRSKPREHFAFHVISRGGCLLEVDGMDPVALADGDVVVLTPGRAHTLRSGPDSVAYDIETLIADGTLCRPGPDPVHLVCGSFRFDGAHGHRLTLALPAVLHVRAADAVDGRWLAQTVDLLTYESFADRPGNATVVNRLCDALFVYLLRSHLAALPDSAPSWLRALDDDQIGEALRLIHADPAHPWSVPALAAHVGMSRSAFAARFATLVGDTPIRYLSRWRAQRADALLRTTDLTLDAIARTVGYDSAVAFSKAFKRTYGRAPGAHRRATAAGR